MTPDEIRSKDGLNLWANEMNAEICERLDTLISDQRTGTNGISTEIRAQTDRITTRLDAILAELKAQREYGDNRIQWSELRRQSMPKSATELTVTSPCPRTLARAEKAEAKVRELNRLALGMEAQRDRALDFARRWRELCFLSGTQAAQSFPTQRDRLAAEEDA